MNIIFMLEFLLKMIALSPLGFARSKSNLFDAFIVFLSVVDYSNF
jgi:hypothetical protein